MRCNGFATFLLVLLLAALSTCARSASAHGVDPIGVAVVEAPDGNVHVRIDRPASLASVELAVVVDAECVAPASRARKLTAARAVDELVFHCGRGLAGRRVRIEGLGATGLDAVFRAQLANGDVQRSVVTAAAPELSLPAASSRWSALAAYLGLGAKHLALGFDHLLFVLGTLLLE